MEISIYNDVLLKKVFNRKIKRPVAYSVASFMDHLSMKNKIDYTIRRLTEIQFQHARIIIEYWNDLEKIIELLKRFELFDYKIILPYKRNRIKPGVLSVNINTKQINQDFLKIFLKRHYGYDFSYSNRLEITPYIILDTGINEIIAFKLYDDRGYYEYHILKRISKS